MTRNGADDEDRIDVEDRIDETEATGERPRSSGTVRASVESATDGGVTVNDDQPTGATGTTGWTGFTTLLRREVLRYVRRPSNTFLPPMITNVLYFAVFGVVLGTRIRPIKDFEYIVFILPGLVVLGTISNAFENSSFSIFHGRWNEYIEEVLTSPLSHESMVAAYILASALRGLLVGTIIGIIGVVFLWLTGSTIPVERPVYLVAFMLVISLLFAGFGVIGGLWARDFDYLTVLNQFIVRPLVFFGGVFYSLDILDPLFRDLSLLNPMVYMVNGVRYGLLSYSDVPPNAALAVLTGLTVVVIAVDVWLFRRGYGLVE